MSKLELQFKNYLESNLSFDQVNEEMKKLSKEYRKKIHRIINGCLCEKLF